MNEDVFRIENGDFAMEHVSFLLLISLEPTGAIVGSSILPDQQVGSLATASLWLAETEATKVAKEENSDDMEDLDIL